LKGVGTTTLPMQVFDYLRWGFDPTIAAASTVSILMTLGAVLIVDRLVGLKTMRFLPSGSTLCGANSKRNACHSGVRSTFSVKPSCAQGGAALEALMPSLADCTERARKLRR
jgi:hypothetical protein